MKASDIVASARKEIGTTEMPPNSNNVIYNTWFYGREVSGSSYPWCCAFIAWLFRHDRDLCKRTASCQDLLAWFEKSGQIVKDPQPGDLVFFKYSTNARRTNHIGLVIGVNGKTISTIEGNTSITSDDNGGAVMMRQRNSKIVAYARPNYDDAYIPVQKGSKGIFVKKLQTILNMEYGHKLEVDGDFGSLTMNALISTQSILGIIPRSGKADDRTWRKLLNI